ncbi:hypothetical protein J31TS4_41570 [Paenibacillus sp. J31TS4]|uniref:LiaF transmembrane domain-containing protein n=1 Tax=Paenibacillus sp. J31TS4 TaxID=2807195 RepID=UPI001B039FBD|nr:hypothetical protein [Paenibacillus sp. J31TS4]GIP40877.1 hypothetical protein J31TS4_41570 [Paenibacillus sp. J31TS4]
MNGKNGLAIVLIGCGALILFNKLGWHGHGLMSYLFPILMVVLGYIGLSSGRKVIGGIVMALGILFLLGKLSGLITFILAIAMIGWGVSVIRSNRAHR